MRMATRFRTNGYAIDSEWPVLTFGKENTMFA